MTSPNPEEISWLRLIVATTTVFGLMGLLAWGLRYVKDRGWNYKGKSQQKRLKLLENLQLDARRRLVIFKCDDKEHLVLLGSNSDVVITTNLSPPPATDKTVTL